MLSVLLCIPPINFIMPELIFMKLGMHIMAPEPISTAHFMNPSYQSVPMCVLLGNGSVKTLPPQRIHSRNRKIVTLDVFYAVRVVPR
jgi:hypothetical protein